MAKIIERLATLETKVKLLLVLVAAQLGIDLVPYASAGIVTLLENITKVL